MKKCEQPGSAIHPSALTIAEDIITLHGSSPACGDRSLANAIPHPPRASRRNPSQPGVSGTLSSPMNISAS